MGNKNKQDRRETDPLWALVHEVRDIFRWIREAKDVQISQLNGENMGQITGTTPGTTSTFGASPLPAGTVFGASPAPAWAVDDAADVTLTPSPDGLSVSAALDAAPPAGVSQYVLTFTAQGANGLITKTANVPINAGGGTGPALATDADISQLS